MPLAQGFGAEVADFDLPEGRVPAEIARLRQAYEAFHLLVFRGAAPVAPERQVEIVGWFGNVLGEGRQWTVLDNAEPTGRAELPFHSDITYMKHPLDGLSLCPEALPRNATSTTYVSNALGWKVLPEALQNELRDRKAQHFYNSSADMGFDWPVFEYWHPACMKHEQTGEP